MGGLNKMVKITSIVGILLISLSFFYYFVIRVKQREAKLENCLKKAESDSSAIFQSMKSSKVIWDIESIEKIYKDECNMCFKKYK